MAKTLLYAGLLLLLAAFSAAFIGRVYHTGTYAGSAELVVTVINHGPTLTGVQVAAFEPVSGSRDITESFRLRDGDASRARLQLGGVPSDLCYPVLITFTDDDDVRRSTHEWVCP